MRAEGHGSWQACRLVQPRCLAAAAGSNIGLTDAAHARQVHGMQPRWKKYLKLPRHAATKAKFNEIIKALEALAEVAWKLQEGPNPSTRCAPSASPCGVAMPDDFSYMAKHFDTRLFVEPPDR